MTTWVYWEKKNQQEEPIDLAGLVSIILSVR